MSDPFGDFILEQEEDEQDSLCTECDHVHSCTTACYYEDDEEWREQEEWKSENYERARGGR